MKLRHATPARNVDSIMAEGLDPEYAQTLSDRKFVWLHSASKTPWSVRHTARRHGVSEADVAVLEVTVPRCWVHRAWPGVWKSADLIPAHRLELYSEGDTC